MIRHIAMWSCPRSTSTVITRSFEQLEGCLVYDEPFYAPYLLTRGLHHPQRQEVLDNVESDFSKAIEKITGNLPPGYQFSFQKHMAKHLLPEFRGDWLYSLENFFLIRDVKKMLFSYKNVCGNVSRGDINMKSLYDLFQDIKEKTGITPVVVSSDDLLQNPDKNLRILCEKLNLDFSTKMLAWESNPKASTLLSALAPGYGHVWYENAMQSTGFFPLTNQTFDLPADLNEILEEEMKI